MHDVPVRDVLSRLGTDAAHGLSEPEAARRLQRTGPNVLPRVERRSALLRLLLQFHHPLIYTLLVAAAVTYAVGEHVDASVILGVVLANAAIGFVQESRAEHALDALACMVTTHATVLRDGRRRRLAAAELVPGDLVDLAAGDKVGADLRLIGVRDLAADESALTGESVPVRKTADPVPATAAVAERTDLAFSGTLVTTGRATGVVVATGGETEIGRIHALLGSTTTLATPLTRKLAAFSRRLTVLIVALAAATFAVGLARGEPAADMLVAAVALAVGAIPEGLPAAVSITLAIGVSRMARRRAIVRRLPAVETLGSTTVICTDKTGTLTQNAMTVAAVDAGGRRYAVAGRGYAPDGVLTTGGEGVEPSGHPALEACLRAGALCGDGDAVRRDGRWEAVGDPTEAALVVAARKAGIDRAAALRERPRVAVLPFDTERRFMATVHRGPAGDDVLYVKGAVERVATMCDGALGADGTTVALDRAALHGTAAGLAGEGQRVLALAWGPAASTADLETPRGLTFLGLQAMADPPRPGAVAAVRACRQAGIAVKMITGDHPGTAAAIAAQVGLVDDGGVRVVTGGEIAATADGELDALASAARVFARVSAEQKLRLVEALQRRGEVVAMTGDGVNDAPALRRADIGVAMGRGGTEVAREAADIVLADDDFATIEAAVEEGRHTFDNLTKFLVWTLPTNLAEGLLIVVAVLLGTVLPVLPVQVLWINMTTAVLLGLTLAFERVEPGIMRRAPRDPARAILTRELVDRIVLVSVLLLTATFGLFAAARAGGTSAAEARTIAIDCFVAVQAFYLFNCRSLAGPARGLPVNRWLLGGVALTAVLQLALTYAPFMHRLFHTAPIEAAAWAAILATGAAAWMVVELEKAVRRRLAIRRLPGWPLRRLPDGGPLPPPHDAATTPNGGP